MEKNYRSWSSVQMEWEKRRLARGAHSSGSTNSPIFCGPQVTETLYFPGLSDHAPALEDPEVSDGDSVPASSE